jgi:hypothetical protein
VAVAAGGWSVSRRAAGKLESETMTNIAEALEQEIQRNRELLKLYEEIPTGKFGAMMIDLDIKNAVAALASGDVVKIIEAYEAMKDNE